MTSPAVPTEITFSGWGTGRTQHVASCTAELAAVIADAVAIGKSSKGDVDLTYFSLVLALLRGQDPWSRWFASLFGPNGFRDVDVVSVRAGSPPRSSSPVSGVVRLSTSVATFFGEKLKNFELPAFSPLDVRDVVGLYLLAPGGAHDKQWNALDVTPERRARWLWTFIRRMRRLHDRQADRWAARALALGIEEPALAVVPYLTPDGWTLVDTLGYERYYTALTDFINDPRTVAPLCISIQAPWGGGKTSLMRMIQAKLDLEAVRLDNPVAVRVLEAAEARRAPSERDENASVDQLKKDASAPRGVLTIRDVLRAVRAWKREPQVTVDEPFDGAAAGERSCMTVWFNAWKYDKTDQVWAGLADAIIKQITRRMKPEKRELFFAKLYFARIDAEKIRAKVYDRIYREALGQLWPWVAGCAALAIGGGAAAVEGLRYAGALAGTSTVAGALIAVAGSLRVAAKVKDEKAASTLSDVMSMPSYASTLGFVHEADADLRRVLATVPDTYWPIVVFIDDLDRCSPTKVAEVMEAVNLFLAGEFARCIFVMGMDTEMVAASLDAAHKAVIDLLPQDSHTPVGWRFMDKFVQLPFVIPPLEQTYTASFPEAVQAAARDPETQSQAVSSSIVTSINPYTVLPEERAAREAAAAGRAPAPRPIFDETDREVKALIHRGVEYFAGNPREIKRFLNAFRLYAFLWEDKARDPRSALTLELIMRWTVFMMKWPDVLRWVRRGSPYAAIRFGDEPNSVPVNRLELLERAAERWPSFSEWSSGVQAAGRIAPDSRWLQDPELHAFFREPHIDELSTGLGHGLW